VFIRLKTTRKLCKACGAENLKNKIPKIQNVDKAPFYHLSNLIVLISGLSILNKRLYSLVLFVNMSAIIVF
jgi:hypothetical protein